MLFQPNETELDDILLDQLAGLDEARLAIVLANRADVLDPPWPRRLADVTRRLSSPDSIVLAMRTLTKPEFQVLRAIRIASALSVEDKNAVDLGRVAALLGTTVAEIAPIVDALSERVLAWPDGAGRVTDPPSQSAIGVDFAGLGPSVAEYLSHLTVEDLKTLAGALHCPVDGRKARMLEQLLEFFREPDRVRDVVDGAPAGVGELLADFVWNGAERELSMHDEYYGYRARRDEPVSPSIWVRKRGLLWRDYDGTATMPLEVGLALRGPDYRLPFAPRPPEPAVVPVPVDRVLAEAATAALRIVDRMCVVVDRSGVRPIPLLKSGRVGARAVKAVAKETGSTVDETRLAVELAIRLLLLVPAEPEEVPETRPRRPRAPLPPPPPVGLVPSERFAAWRTGSSAHRLRSAVGAWWTLPLAPLADEKVVRAVLGDGPNAAFSDVRQLVVRLLTELPDGSGSNDAASLSELAAWHAPLINPTLLGTLVTAALAEAALLGLAGSGAPGELARAMVAGTPGLGRPIDLNDPTLVSASDRLVSGARTTALFGADLTAVVTGPPDAELAGLLDRVADRETHGAASVWRFSPRSVRDALDGGSTPAELIEQLRTVAAKPLPQPLEYLINDVARRHGEVGVVDVGSVIVGTEPALLTEIAAHRKLAALALRSVAPTVLVSGEPAGATIAALRAAGYAPVLQDSDGAVRVRLATGHAPASVPDAFLESIETWPPAADPREQAARLLRAPAKSEGHTLRRGAIGDLLFRTLRERPSSDWMHLAWQLESGLPTKVTYLEPDGERRQLLISQVELLGNALDVWCAETSDYRRLELARVRPAS